MSTTFGIKIKDKTIEIARRVGGPNGAQMWFTDEVVAILSDETPVEPLDNTAQGIFTIGDIRKHIKKQNEVTNKEIDDFFNDDLPF
jgi:hypothetical protein